MPLSILCDILWDIPSVVPSLIQWARLVDILWDLGIVSPTEYLIGYAKGYPIGVKSMYCTSQGQGALLRQCDIEIMAGEV